MADWLTCNRLFTYDNVMPTHPLTQIFDAKLFKFKYFNILLKRFWDHISWLGPLSFTKQYDQNGNKTQVIL